MIKFAKTRCSATQTQSARKSVFSAQMRTNISWKGRKGRYYKNDCRGGRIGSFLYAESRSAIIKSQLLGWWLIGKNCSTAWSREGKTMGESITKNSFTKPCFKSSIARALSIWETGNRNVRLIDKLGLSINLPESLKTKGPRKRPLLTCSEDSAHIASSCLGVVLGRWRGRDSTVGNNSFGSRCLGKNLDEKGYTYPCERAPRIGKP